MSLAVSPTGECEVLLLIHRVIPRHREGGEVKEVGGGGAGGGFSVGGKEDGLEVGVGFLAVASGDAIPRTMINVWPTFCGIAIQHSCGIKRTASVEQPAIGGCMAPNSNTRDGVRPAPDDPHASADAVPDPLGDILERTSPEGRPPRPAMKSWQIRHLVLALTGVLLIVGILVAIFVHPMVGFVGTIGSLVMFALNPALWATFSRIRERKDAEEQLKDH